MSANPHTEGARAGFDITVESREGSLLRARIRVPASIPPGGTDLSVLYDAGSDRVVEVRPFRNLGVFILLELRRLGGSAGGGH
jgi:hypothetical protein